MSSTVEASGDLIQGSEAKNAIAGTDPGRFVIGIISLLLLAGGLLGWAIGSQPLKSTCFLVFVAIGLGTGLLQPFNRLRGLRFVTYGVGMSGAILLLVGFLLIELRLWSLGTAVFVAIAAFAALAHVYGVATNADVNVIGDQVGLVAESANSGIAALLAAGGTALCLILALFHQNTDLPMSGILGAVPIFWYVGVAAIVAAIILARNLDSWVLGLCVVLLVATISFTPIIMMNLPMFAWGYKHVGMTNLFIRTGRIQPGTGLYNGLYQAWPALFAGVGWVSHATGVENVNAISRWWPLLLDLGWLAALRVLADRVGLTRRQAWFATAFFFLSITIGQDYFSPQSITYFLAIVFFALAFQMRGEATDTVTPIEWVMLVAISCAIAFTHQLTPFMMTAAVVIMLLFGYLRSWIIAFVAIVPAGIWTLTHTGPLRGLVGTKTLGVTGNISTPGSQGVGILHNGNYVHLSVAGQAVAAGVLGILALITLLRARDRLHLMLAVCAASGAGLLLVSSYDNEGIYRVVLFAAPWLAVLAFSTQVTGPVEGREDGFSIATLVLLPVMVVAYLFGALGISYGYQTHQGDLNVINQLAVQDSVPAIVFSMGFGGVPAYETGIFNQRYYPYDYMTKQGLLNGKFNADRALQFFEIYLATPGASPGEINGEIVQRHYVLFSEQGLRSSELRGVINRNEYLEFERAFATSTYWRKVDQSSSATAFVLAVPKKVLQDRIAPK